MHDRFTGLPDDETNIEGIAAEYAARMPLEDPPACRDICQLLPVIVEALLSSRAARQRRSPGS